MKSHDLWTFSRHSPMFGLISSQARLWKYRNHIFTARKRSLRRLCFYTCLSVLLFTGGEYLGRYTPQAGIPPTPLGRYTPLGQVHPPGQVHLPSGAGTPPGRYTPLDRYTSLGRYTPRSSACWEIRATSGQYASYWNAFLSQSASERVLFVSFNLAE